ncbi:MAG: lysozyme inhibitor LprI family protein [Pararhizobium sp.]
MKTIVFFVVAGVGLGVVPARAQQPKIDCAKAESQMELTSCSGLAFEKADEALNALWPKIVAAAKARDADQGDEMRSLGVPTTLEALKDAQRRWIAFRDAECSYESYAAFGGTMAPMLGSDCKTRLTKARIAELKASIENN